MGKGHVVDAAMFNGTVSLLICFSAWPPDGPLSQAWLEYSTETLSRDLNGVARWFKRRQAKLVTARSHGHINASRNDKIALVYDLPVMDRMERLTYQKLTNGV